MQARRLTRETFVQGQKFYENFFKQLVLSGDYDLTTSPSSSSSSSSSGSPLSSLGSSPTWSLLDMWSNDFDECPNHPDNNLDETLYQCECQICTSNIKQKKTSKTMPTSNSRILGKPVQLAHRSPVTNTSNQFFVKREPSFDEELSMSTNLNHLIGSDKSIMSMSQKNRQKNQQNQQNGLCSDPNCGAKISPCGLWFGGVDCVKKHLGETYYNRQLRILAPPKEKKQNKPFVLFVNRFPSTDELRLILVAANAIGLKKISLTAKKSSIQ